MNQLQDIPLRLCAKLLRSGGTVLGLLIIGYFGIFALQGDRGYASLQHTQREVVEAEARLADITARREAIERKVIALRPSSIDGDLLDEEVRASLGFVRQGDMVILNR